MAMQYAIDSEIEVLDWYPGEVVNLLPDFSDALEDGCATLNDEDDVLNDEVKNNDDEEEMRTISDEELDKKLEYKWGCDDDDNDVMALLPEPSFLSNLIKLFELNNDGMEEDDEDDGNDGEMWKLPEDDLEERGDKNELPEDDLEENDNNNVQNNDYAEGLEEQKSEANYMDDEEQGKVDMAAFAAFVDGTGLTVEDLDYQDLIKLFELNNDGMEEDDEDDGNDGEMWKLPGDDLEEKDDKNELPEDDLAKRWKSGDEFLSLVQRRSQDKFVDTMNSGVIAFPEFLRWAMDDIESQLSHGTKPWQSGDG